VDITTLQQEFVPADYEMARNLNIEEGDTVNYRVVIIKSDEPLIYAISLVPVDRLDNDFKEDLIRADFPIGRIMKIITSNPAGRSSPYSSRNQMKNLKKYSKPIPPS